MVIGKCMRRGAMAGALVHAAGVAALACLAALAAAAALPDAAHAQGPPDSDAPSIVSVDATRVLTGPDSSAVYVSVMFNETVRVQPDPDSAPPAVRVVVAGEPAEAAYASLSSDNKTVVFRYDSNQAGSGPAAGYVTYASAMPFALNNGSITDEAGNAADLEMPRIAARLDSAAVTAGNEMLVAYSMPAYASPSDYANLTLVPGGPRTVTAVAGNGTTEHVLTFGGAPAPIGATATMDVAELGDRPPAYFAGASGVRVDDGREGFTIAGYIGDPFPVPLQSPSGLAEGADGTIVVADTLGGHVAVYREDGTFVREMGTKGYIDTRLVADPADQGKIYRDLGTQGYVDDSSLGFEFLSSNRGHSASRREST